MDKLKILIAEDDVVTQMFYKKGLKEDVFLKAIVDNGEEALRVYSNWKPEILLLDIKMPVKSGYEVLKEIRRRESFISESMKGRAKNTAIIALTDLFEALTAKDRPYKKPIPLEKASAILGFEVKDNHIDKYLYEFFKERKIYEKI